MRHDFTLVAFAGLALGVCHILGYLGDKAHRQADPVQTWEGEGGAVPVTPNRTAAQVGPSETP